MKNIVHIFTEDTFIGSVKRFNCTFFSNTTILISNDTTNTNSLIKGVHVFRFTLRESEEIINVCSTADLVVIHGLCRIKAPIVNKLPIGLKIGLRFYGGELYKRIDDRFYTKLTIKQLKLKPYNSVLFSLRKSLSQIKSFLLGKPTDNKIFWEAFSRFEFFFGLFEDEYLFLKSIWPKLPMFIQLPYAKAALPQFVIQEKKNILIIGNSRSPFNNHFDIFKTFDRCRFFNRYEVILPFNYGHETAYSHQLRKTFEKYSNIKLLSSFLERDDYEKLFKESSTLIINTLRQMAMGNIFIALRYGLKVYLNRGNLAYHWLKDEGFIISTVDLLTFDLENKNIKLSVAEIKHNQQQLIRLSEKYSVGEFQSLLNERLSLI
jgi:hypothetical protein